MTFLDFFAGIGGMRSGLELAGHECIGFCEKDKYAILAYRAMYNTDGEWFENDITKINTDTIPKADIWAGGFPCQGVSIAGLGNGLRDERSGLYFEFIKLIKSVKEENKPRWLIIENVKNLLSINVGIDYLDVLCELDEAGYDASWQVINTKDYLPQNRERIFIVAERRVADRSPREVLPITGENKNADIKVIGDIADPSWIQHMRRVYSEDGSSPCLSTCSGGNLQPKILIDGCQGNKVYDTDGIATCITSQGGGLGRHTNLYCIDQSTVKTKITDTARCITARLTAGIVNRTAQNSGVIEVMPVLTPDRLEKRQNGRRINDDENAPSYCLTVQDRQGIAIINDRGTYGEKLKASEHCPAILATDAKGPKKVLDINTCRIRRLVPQETYRLQGFSDEQFFKAQAVLSDSQLYKTAGNAISVPVAFAIGKRLAEVMEDL